MKMGTNPDRILMELESDEAVEWFMNSDIWKEFAVGLHPEVIIKR